MGFGRLMGPRFGGSNASLGREIFGGGFCAWFLSFGALEPTREGFPERVIEEERDEDEVERLVVVMVVPALRFGVVLLSGKGRRRPR